MGICVTLGFFVFGLTVETFDLKMTAAFYSLTVAALLAIATHHGSQEK
jgi:O-antigen ligase